MVRPAGYALVTAFVIFVSSVPIGIPVVTTTVLAVGARQMAKEKAIVARWAMYLSVVLLACAGDDWLAIAQLTHVFRSCQTF